MRRNLGLTLLLLFFIVAGLFVSRPGHRIERGGDVPPVSDQPGQVPGVVSPTPTPIPTTSPVARSAERGEFSRITPTAETLREEVRGRPHGPPPSLLRFTDQVSARMEESLPDEARAGNLLQEFGECLRRTDLSSSVQAICLRNAGRLSEAHESLRPEYERIREQAPEGAGRILRSFERG